MCSNLSLSCWAVQVSTTRRFQLVWRCVQFLWVKKGEGERTCWGTQGPATEMCHRCLVKDAWNLQGSRRGGVQTVLTGTASKVESMGDWLGVAAAVMPDRGLLEHLVVAARTAVAGEVAKIGVVLARSLEVVVVAAYTVHSACSGGLGWGSRSGIDARSPPGCPACVLPTSMQNRVLSSVDRCRSGWPPRNPLWRGSEKIQTEFQYDISCQNQWIKLECNLDED